MNEVKQLASATGRSLNAIYKLKRKLGRLPTEKEVRDQRRGRPEKKRDLYSLWIEANCLYIRLLTAKSEYGEKLNYDTYEKLSRAIDSMCAAETTLEEIRNDDEYIEYIR